MYSLTSAASVAMSVAVSVARRCSLVEQLGVLMPVCPVSDLVSSVDMCHSQSPASEYATLCPTVQKVRGDQGEGETR